MTALTTTTRPRQLIPPHGGVLVNRVLDPEARPAALAAASRLPAVRLSSVQFSDALCIATGVFSPLTGFVSHADYESILDTMHLANGLVWSIPVTLAVAADLASAIGIPASIALEDPDGRIVATMEVTEKFSYDKQREALAVYRTGEAAHPGVARLYGQGEVLLAGPITLIERPPSEPFAAFRRDPADTRRLFEDRGWRRVVGFQTRNPVHRAHEYIQKAALEMCDGLLLNPLVGETKSDDISAATRMASYQVLIDHYYPTDRVVLSVFPAAMRYAGPREAIFHAMARKNYGCSHFIVGRDHAGVGNYYGTYDAQQIFDEFAPEELGITPLFFEHTFFCRSCGGMASTKTCPHDGSTRVTLSGTQVREMLTKGQIPPPEFTRAEVAQVLIDGMRA
jgi:sulfate adenylyltransferase